MAPHEFPAIDQETLTQWRSLLDQTFREFVRTHGDAIETMFSPLLDYLLWSEHIFMNSPWYLVLAAILTIAWVASRSIKIVATTAVILCLIGWMGLWAVSMQTVSLVVASTAIIFALFAVSCSDDDTTTPTINAIVIPLQTTIQDTVPLAVTSNFALLAGSSVTSTGQTVITGDLGLSPGTSVGGFPPGVLNGTLRINDILSVQAKLDLVAAYNNAAARVTTDMVTLSGNIGGLTLTPGLYKSNSTLAISSGDLTFDAKGNADAVFIIQIASALTVTSARFAP
jgi:hypothetical protein